MTSVAEGAGASGLRPTALVTGATGGIGNAVARGLARSGFRVVATGRDEQKGAALLEQLAGERAGHLEVGHRFVPADLSLLSGTAALADEVARSVDRLDAVVCCAGDFALRPEWTSEGLERCLVLNYLSRFLLARRLLPLLLEAPSGRLVLVANAGRYRDSLDLDDLQHRRGRPGLRVCGRSQFANDLFAVELAERYRGTALEVSCVFPGVTRTDLFASAAGTPRLLRRALTWLAGRVGLAPDEAADTPVWLAAGEAATGLSGSFFGPHSSPIRVPERARRADRRQLLWAASESLISLPELVEGPPAPAP